MINGVEQRNPNNKNEKRWFSLIANKVEELDYGNIEFRLVIKAGKVVSIKMARTEESFNISEGF